MSGILVGPSDVFPCFFILFSYASLIRSFQSLKQLVNYVVTHQHQVFVEKELPSCHKEKQPSGRITFSASHNPGSIRKVWWMVSKRCSSMALLSKWNVHYHQLLINGHNFQSKMFVITNLNGWPAPIPNPARINCTKKNCTCWLKYKIPKDCYIDYKTSIEQLQSNPTIPFKSIVDAITGKTASSTSYGFVRSWKAEKLFEFRCRWHCFKFCLTATTLSKNDEDLNVILYGQDEIRWNKIIVLSFA